VQQPLHNLAVSPCAGELINAGRIPACVARGSKPPSKAESGLDVFTGAPTSGVCVEALSLHERSRRPQERAAVLSEYVIRRDERQAIELSLRHEHAIERISMMLGKGGCREGMVQRDG